MPDWAYIAIAYTIVGGSLAAYSLLLARRVAQAQEVARTLHHSLSGENETGE